MAVSSQSGVSTWMSAAVITAVWHAVWWMGLSPRTHHTAIAPPPVPRLSYVPVIAAHSGTISGDVRALWSPVLFSLPTAVGFSRTVLNQSAGIGPPVETPLPPEVLMERVPASGAGAMHPRSMHDPVAVLRRMPEVRDHLTVPELTSGNRSPLQVYALGTDAELLPEDLPLPARKDLGVEPWETEVELVVAEEGWITRVLLMSPPADPAVAQAVSRALYRWRYDPGVSRRLQLVLRFRPPPPLPSDGSNGVGL